MTADGSFRPGDLRAVEAGLDADLLADLRAAGVRPGRPLLAVDADEVLVDLAGHLGRFARTRGIVMSLTRYQLEGAFREQTTGRVLPFDEAVGLIDAFFEDEVRRQRPLPGAEAALRRLAEQAQVVVLTNVPRHGRAGRVENLAGLGMDYPVICNSGGKGRALAWLSAVVAAPVAFVDDSPTQIASAAKGAPGALRVHFTGAELVARVIPKAPDAHHRVGSWPDAERVLAQHFG